MAGALLGKAGVKEATTGKARRGESQRSEQEEARDLSETGVFPGQYANEGRAEGTFLQQRGRGVSASPSTNLGPLLLHTLLSTSTSLLLSLSKKNLIRRFLMQILPSLPPFSIIFFDT